MARRAGWTASALALVPIGAPAAAAVSAANPAGVVAALERAGYAPRLDRDSDGDPMVRFLVGAKSVQLLFFGCTANRDCDSLQLTTGYDMPEGITPEQAIEWMRDNRWGKVHLDDERDPFVQYDIVTGRRGLPEDVFATIIATYRSTIERFAAFVGF